MNKNLIIRILLTKYKLNILYFILSKKLKYFINKSNIAYNIPIYINNMSSPIVKECSICFDNLLNSNCCTIKCGHEFCFTCISHYIATTARNDYTQDITCPLCRDLMVEGKPEEDDEDDEDDETITICSDESIEPDEDGNIINIASLFRESRDDDDDDDDDDEIRDDQEENVANIELVTKKLTEKGFTVVDLASVLFNRFNRNDPKYTNRYINRMIDNMYEVIDELDEIADAEYNERLLFAEEDVRVQ